MGEEALQQQGQAQYQKAGGRVPGQLAAETKFEVLGRSLQEAQKISPSLHSPKEPSEVLTPARALPDL